MGAVDVRDRLINLLNAVVPVRKFIRRAMVWLVPVESAGLEVQFVCFLKVGFELRPCLMIIIKTVPFEDGGREEACYLDCR